MGGYNCRSCTKQQDNELELNDDKDNPPLSNLRSRQSKKEIATDNIDKANLIDKNNYKEIDINISNNNDSADIIDEENESIKAREKSPSQSPKNSNLKKAKVSSSQALSKAPLEIINELNGELSKDSIKESEAKMRERDKLMSAEIKESVLKMLDEQEKQIEKNISISSHSNTNKNIEEIKRNSIIENSASIAKDTEGFVYRNGLNSNLPGYNSLNSEIKLTNNNSTNKKNHKKSLMYTGMDAWRNINITNIVPESKLLKNDDEGGIVELKFR
jgi:hypothetical protein